MLLTFYFMHRSDPMIRERAMAVLVDFCHTKLRFKGKNILGTSFGIASTRLISLLGIL